MIINTKEPLYFSEIGRKDNQEDFLWPCSDQEKSDSIVYILCDGVGGHDHGEIASKTVATALGECIVWMRNRKADTNFTVKEFGQALEYAYDALDTVDTHAEKKMGTTLTCLLIHGGGIMAAHMGDSRIYHIRPSLGGNLSSILYQSSDHSLVNELLLAGKITEAEAKTFPQRHAITRAMQPHQEKRCKADVYQITDVKEGDYFFLCSDGVLEQLSNENLCVILADNTLDDKGKMTAIRKICDGRTQDNYSCWLIPIDKVFVEQVPPQQNFLERLWNWLWN